MKLIALDRQRLALNIDHTGMAPFLYFTYREQGRSFEDVGMWNGSAVSVTGLAEPERVNTLDVTDGMLPLLKVQPALGRLFSRQDESPGSPETAGF